MKHTELQTGEAYLYVRGVEALLPKCESAGFDIVRPLETKPSGCATSSCATPTAS